MKTEKLNIHYDIDYSLMAIRTQLEDYQFAYFLNKSPFFLFERMPKDLSCVINEKSVYFSTFEHKNDDLQRSCFLIRNKSVYENLVKKNTGLFGENNFSNIAFLIPELKEFDYFIKLVGVWKKSELLCLKKILTRIKHVESETNVNLNKIKSINNLVF